MAPSTVAQLEARVKALRELCLELAKVAEVDVDAKKYPMLFESVSGEVGGVKGLEVSGSAGGYVTPKEGEFQTLTYGHDHDGKGLVAWIATAGGEQEWSNPYDTQLIGVYASSIQKGNLREFVDRKFSNQILYTTDVPYSWISIDFGKYRVRPTVYTLAHRAKMARFFLRSWSLHGSVDGVNWDALCRHEEDETLSERRMTASFHVPDCHRYYRMLRVVAQPGGNSGFSSVLVASCFEVYGDFFLAP